MLDTDPKTPHRYVSEGVNQWRTCVICGRGANASIHKSDDCPTPGQGTHYTETQLCP